MPNSLFLSSMKSKIILFLTLLLFPIVAFWASTPTMPDSWVFSLLKDVNTNKAALSEKESAVTYEETNIEKNKEDIKQIKSLALQLDGLEESITTLQKFYTGGADISENQDYKTKLKTFDSTIWNLFALLSTSEPQIPTFLAYKWEKEDIKKKIEAKLQELNKSISDSQTIISSSQEELKTLTDAVNKSEAAFQTEVQDFIIKIIVFIISLAIIWFIWGGIKRLIKAQKSISSEKKEMFLLIAKWIKNVLIILVTFAFFFSEFVSILPFVAIIWVAFGYALRDVIASFIAWFIIGLKDGIYSVGDSIDVDGGKIIWKVVKITSLITIVQDNSMSGPSGAYIIFPNKKIFDSTIKNSSRLESWWYATIDFYLDPTSDVILGKEKLMQAISEVLSTGNFRSPTSHKSFFKKYGYTDKSLQPQVFLRTDSQGILLRGKIFALASDRGDIHSQIVEKFLTLIRNTQDIRIAEGIRNVG